MKNLNKYFYKKKISQPITCLTAYSSSFAKILDGNVDIILIGDSLGTTLYGIKNTQNVTLDMMKMHGLAVTKNVHKSITVIDMPYKTYVSNKQALNNAKSLISFTKAAMLKIEINKNNLSILKYLVKNNLNIIAHIGVTPQSYYDFKKIKVVGKNLNESKKLVNLALEAEIAGAKALLLECVTKDTARKITASVKIPTIGIGSSKYCDGQVLVFDDLIRVEGEKKLPKFVNEQWLKLILCLSIWAVHYLMLKCLMLI